MGRLDSSARGREAFDRGQWADAFAHYSSGDEEVSLEPDDLERFATAAYLVGRYAYSIEIRGRAHQGYVSQHDAEGAARTAFWQGLQMLFTGERARGGGWIARAKRLLDDMERECVVQGFVLLPAGIGALGSGAPEHAYETFTRARAVGRRFAEADLIALGLLGQGQSLVRMSEVEQGVALLDEAMTSAEAGDLSPVVVGILYCAVIETCREIFDLRRATEWTTALSDWCEAQPDLVPYRGQCLVRRSEIMQLQGDWPAALTEACTACDVLAQPLDPAIGAAYYQRGELHRLRGEFDDAVASYSRANEFGRKPQPGLALLRVAQGRVAAGKAAIGRALADTSDRLTRCRILPSYVEITLAAGDVPAARTAATELSDLVREWEAPYLTASAAGAHGAVLLAEDAAEPALEALRDACTTWQALVAPYEIARVRCRIGLAARKLGDEDTAKMELEAARSAFHRLGAAPDLAHVDAILRSPSSDRAHGLTARELEVLRLVAAGESNRAIGIALSISERTVERHVSNIFTKLQVSSRSAATAYAYGHSLV